MENRSKVYKYFSLLFLCCVVITASSVPVKMVQIAGNYKHERDENVAEFLREVGVAEEVIQYFTQPKTTIEVSVEGNTYEIKTNYGLILSYTDGKEFEEQLLKGAKSIPKREGNSIIVNTKLPNGHLTKRVYEFTHEGITVVFTLGDMTATRYYKRI